MCVYVCVCVRVHAMATGFVSSSFFFFVGLSVPFIVRLFVHILALASCIFSFIVLLKILYLHKKEIEIKS